MPAHRRALLFGTALAASLALLSGAWRGGPTAASARFPVLRLHVIAHSDAPADQRAKLAVRDAVAPVLAAAVRGATGPAEALSAARAALPAAERAARAALAAAGAPAAVRVEVGRFAFPRSRSAGIAAAGGEYAAVRVVIGEGRGRNWWCVLVPPLCVIESKGEVALAFAADVDTVDYAEIDAQGRLVINPRRLGVAPPEIRFALLEWLNSARDAPWWVALDRWLHR